MEVDPRNRKIWIEENKNVIMITVINDNNLYERIHIPIKNKAEFILTLNDYLNRPIENIVEEIKEKKISKIETRELVLEFLQTSIKHGWNSSLIITENSHLKLDLGLDDIALGGFCYEIENQYNCEINITEMETIKNVIDAILENKHPQEEILVEFL
jgi:acyl carrier protein